MRGWFIVHGMFFACGCFFFYIVSMGYDACGLREGVLNREVSFISFNGRKTVLGKGAKGVYHFLLER